MSDETRKPGRLYCSFCAKSDREVEHMVSGPSVMICEECVELAVDIIRDRKAEKGQGWPGFDRPRRTPEREG